MPYPAAVVSAVDAPALGRFGSMVVGRELPRPDLLSPAEEASLLAVLDGLDYDDVRMRGQTARRSVRHYGFRYGYELRELVPTDPLPEPLSAVRDRCAEVIGVPGTALAETLVTRYPPGAGISRPECRP